MEIKDIRRILACATVFFLGWGAYLYTFYSVQVDPFSKASVQTIKQILIAFGIAGAASLLLFITLRPKPRSQIVGLAVILGIAVFATALLGWDWFTKTHNFMSPEGFRGYLMILCLTPVALYGVPNIYRVFGRRRSKEEDSTGLFIVSTAISLLIIFSLLLIISPLQLHYRSIEEPGAAQVVGFNPYVRLGLGLPLSVGLSLLLSTLKPARRWFGVASASLAFYCFAKLYLVFSSGPKIDVDVIVGLMRRISISGMMADYCLLLACVALALLLNRYSRGRLLVALIFVLSVSYLGLLLEARTSIPRQSASLESANADAVPKIRLSSNSHNIVMFLLDEYQGSIFHDLIESTDFSRADFDGFYYFPNSASVANLTLYNIAPILGGPEYTPDAILRRNPNASFDDAAAEAYQDLLNRFEELGYELNIVSPPLYKCDKIQKRFHSYCRRQLFDWVSTEGLANSLGGVKDPPLVSFRRDLIIALIRMGLLSFQKELANKLPDFSGRLAIQKKRKQWLGLKNVKNIFELGATKNTFTFIYNYATHRPFILNSDCEIEVKNSSRINTARCVTRSLLEFFEWLKANSVYDRSTIVVVSDHGMKKGSARNSLAVASGRGPVRENFIATINSLALVKPPESSGPLKVDMALLSVADYPRLLCTYGPDCLLSELRAMPSDKQVSSYKIKEYFSYLSGDKRYKIEEKYTAIDSIFDPANWTRSPND